MQKILIVDDNSDVLHVMQLLLTSRGYIVEVTTNGEETISLVNQFAPDLIFLDVYLSGIDGRDISRKLKSSKETKCIPVILFSANIFKGGMLAEALADDFVAKPFDIHELLTKVNNFLGSAEKNKSLIA